MKLLEVTPEKLVFEMSGKEQSVLVDLLGLYPLIPPGHQRISIDTHSKVMEEEQKLLDDALAAQRAAHKAHLRAWLQESGRFVPRGEAVRFELSAGDVEWLLQVLGDLRVGSWIRLGSPDYAAERQLQVTRENVQFVWARELGGLFQMALLHGLSNRS